MTLEIVPIAGTDIRHIAGQWAMPAALRAEVPASWARMQARQPHVWDGRILGFTPPVIGADGILRSEALEDAYSAFLAWREAGFPDIGVVHIFGAALIHSADGALIFGIMGPKTVNAGRVYPPGGSLEPRDIDADGIVDVDRCIELELDEETGLAAGMARKGQMLMVADGPRIAILRAFHFGETADVLLRIIRANLDRQEDRELADVVAVRNADEGRAAGRLADYAAVVLDALAAGRLRL